MKSVVTAGDHALGFFETRDQSRRGPRPPPPPSRRGPRSPPRPPPPPSRRGPRSRSPRSSRRYPPSPPPSSPPAGAPTGSGSLSPSSFIAALRDNLIRP